MDSEYIKTYAILIVDDNSTFREAFRHTLNSVLGEKIEFIDEASSGEEALELINNKFFDYIFMDINMPGMGGIKTAKMVDYQNNRMKIIAVSFHKEFEIMQQMIEAGARKYLKKDEINPDKIKAIFNDR